MSRHFSPRIVTDGLVLCLDAGNKESYPGTGSTWRDLGVNGYNFSLANGPTFSSANCGSIVFNGTNNYCSTSTNIVPVGDTSKSMFIWFISRTTITTRQWLIYTGSDTNGGRFALEIDQGKLAFNYYNSSISSTDLLRDTWYHAGVTYNSVTKQLSIYLNGILQSTSTFPITVGGSPISINTGSSTGTYIGSFVGSSIYLNGNVSNAFIYNRELTSIEVAQNFNATRGRFGI